MSEEMKRFMTGVGAVVSWFAATAYLILVGTDVVEDSWRGFVSVLVGLAITLTVLRHNMRITGLIRKSFIAGAMAERDEKEIERVSKTTSLAGKESGSGGASRVDGRGGD